MLILVVYIYIRWIYVYWIPKVVVLGISIKTDFQKIIASEEKSPSYKIIVFLSILLIKITFFSIVIQYLSRVSLNNFFKAIYV